MQGFFGGLCFYLCLFFCFSAFGVTFISVIALFNLLGVFQSKSLLNMWIWWILCRQSLNKMIAGIVSTALHFERKRNCTKYIFPFLHFFLGLFSLAGMKILHILPQKFDVFHYSFLFATIVSVFQDCFTCYWWINSFVNVIFEMRGDLLLYSHPPRIQVCTKSVPLMTLQKTDFWKLMTKHSYLIWRQKAGWFFLVLLLWMHCISSRN